MTRKKRTWLIAALLAAALAFRLALAIGWPNDEPDDARFYQLLARNLVNSGVYSGASAPPLTPTYVRVPGFPIFIAGAYKLFGIDNNTAVRVWLAIVETATCWSVACLALALAPRRWPERTRWRIQCAALAFAAACPFTAIYVTTVLTEVLAMALGTALAWFAARAINASMAPADAVSIAGGHAWAWWLAAGLAGGALTIVRPEGGLLIAGAGSALVAVAFWRQFAERERWIGVVRNVAAGGLMLTIGFLVVEGPWIVRNFAVFGIFESTAPATVAMPNDFVTSGYARWLKTWVNDPKYVGPFEFDQDRARFSVDQLPPWAFDSQDERKLVTELFAIYNDGRVGASGAQRDTKAPPAGLTPVLDRRFEALAQDRIQRHPIRYYVLLPAERIFWIWVGPHSQYYPFDGDLFPLDDLDHSTNQHIWLPLFAALTVIWSIAGGAGAMKLLITPGARAGLLLLILVIVPRLVLIGSMENPEPRYTVELFPFLSALAAVAIGSIWRRADESKPLPD